MPKKEDYWKDPERYRAKTREWAVKNPAVKRKQNRDWIKEKRRTDPEFAAKEQASRNKWREANPETVKRYMEGWHKDHPNYHMFKNAQFRAKKTGVPFAIVQSDIEITECCPVLGMPFGKYKGQGSGGFKNDSPTLDRIVPALGYVRGNIRVISFRANTLKRDATIEELEQVIAYMRRETG